MRKLCRKYRQGIQDRQCMYNRTLRRVRATTVAVQKQKLLHILSVCLQPQVSSMQCTRAILSAVPSPALRYFSTLSHTRHNFRKKFIENKLCFVIFSITFSAIFLILRIIKRDMIINVQKSRKYYIFSVCVCCFRYPACNATWENNIRYCKYSQVLLMMGQNIARNMQR